MTQLSDAVSRWNKHIFLSFVGMVIASAIGTLIGALLLLRFIILWPSLAGAGLSLAAALWLVGNRGPPSSTRTRRWAAQTCLGFVPIYLVSRHLHGDNTTGTNLPSTNLPVGQASCERWCHGHEEGWARKCACSACSSSLHRCAPATADGRADAEAVLPVLLPTPLAEEEVLRVLARSVELQSLDEPMRWRLLTTSERRRLPRYATPWPNPNPNP